MRWARPATASSRQSRAAATCWWPMRRRRLLRRRCQSLRPELRAGGAAAVAPRPSIAVLPFKSPPDQAEGTVLARDVAADLVAELARSPDLRVVSSQSSFQFDAARTPLAEIGRALRSRYIVDGTV